MTIAIGQYTIRRASGPSWTLWLKVDEKRMVYVGMYTTQLEAQKERRRLETGEQW